MRWLEVACDGCDIIEHVTLPIRGEFVLDGWIAHRTEVFENGADAYAISADLCPACAQKMRRAINPANWPRMKEAPKDRIERAVA